MIPARRILAILIFIVTVIALGATAMYLSPDAAGGNGSMPQQAYIWNRAWTPAVHDSIRTSAPSFAAYVVLAAEVSFRSAWLKANDPKAADRFYKALVTRCGATALGRAAKLKKWFPDAKP